MLQILERQKKYSSIIVTDERTLFLCLIMLQSFPSQYFGYQLEAHKSSKSGYL